MKENQVSFREHGVMSRRRRIAMWTSAAVAAAAVSASLLAGLAPASARATSGAIPAQAIGRLHAYALAFARQNGDATPASVLAVKTTLQKALKAVSPDNTVPGSASVTVYLIVMKGEFTVNFPVPKGSREPTGSNLSIMLSPTTFQLIDLGLNNHAPSVSLRRLGPVSTLTR
jgi:hypothetical protein